MPFRPTDQACIRAVNNEKLAKAQALHRAGRLPEAERAYSALLAHSDDVDAQHGLALLLNQTGRSAEAIPLLQQVLVADGESVSSRLVLARCLAATGELKASIEQCDIACEMLPDNPAAWNLAGQLQQQAGDSQAALDKLQRALNIDPTHGPALHNQGIALATLGQNEAALLAYEGALRVMPAAARVYYNYALALQVAGREADAMAALSKTLDLRPGMADARLRPLQLKLLHCEWRGLVEQTRALPARLDKLLDTDTIGQLSLHVLNLLDVPQSLHRELARRMARHIQIQATGIARPKRAGSTEDKRIRLAYLSPDLGAHAVGGLVQDLFAHHDAGQFEVCIFSLRAFDDVVARVTRAGAQRFVDLSASSIADAAASIASFAPDILVDLGGYTQGARTELMAMRLAPVQVSWLGYLNTMGAEFIDYLIADDVVVPADHEARYDEKIARLPRCFLPYSKLEESPAVMQREDVGLPQDAFVFASFNNPCKIQPAEFRAWIRILREAPDSVLWVYDGNRESVRKNLREALSMAKIDLDRLVFAPMVPMHEHLTRMRLADLFLDTFRYNAGATAIAAAQAGLPLLTLKGNTLLARMGASVNSALGLSQLVCDDVDRYVARAGELAADSNSTSRLRAAIEDAAEQGSGLFDTRAFAADLEALFKTLHAQRRD